eukprot:TRINITY_DN63947_c0_g1_i1.p1 TRINITY_DN63947_c0_g1~~TRINITY_DN63947_c0_g1_i1.p1  ORF type:complete len:370 (-),score=96.48 TRINITY_DN63947_c0_g1_i1:59-1168(-)
MSRGPGHSLAALGFNAEEVHLIEALTARLRCEQNNLSQAEASVEAARARAQEQRASAEALLAQRRCHMQETEALQAEQRRDQRQQAVLKGQLEEASEALGRLSSGAHFRLGVSLEEHAALCQKLSLAEACLAEIEGEKLRLKKALAEVLAAPTEQLRLRPAWHGERPKSAREASGMSLPPRSSASPAGAKLEESRKVRMAVERLGRETIDLKAQVSRERARAESLAVREESLRVRGRQLEAALQRGAAAHAEELEELRAELQAGAVKVRDLMDLASRQPGQQAILAEAAISMPQRLSAGKLPLGSDARSDGQADEDPSSAPPSPSVLFAELASPGVFRTQQAPDVEPWVPNSWALPACQAGPLPPPGSC